MRYVAWTTSDGPLEEPIVELWTEVDERGYVTREIGFDADGKVRHLMPADGYPHGTYGLFDMALIDPTPASHDLEVSQFEATWRAASRNNAEPA